jgi:hypothetical protein
MCEFRKLMSGWLDKRQSSHLTAPKTRLRVVIMRVLREFLPNWWARRSERERLLVAFAVGQIAMGIVVALTLAGKLGGPISVNWLKSGAN